MDERPVLLVKSSFSYANGNCVQIASLHDGKIGLRHSKSPDELIFSFTRKEWAAFLGGIRNGEFDIQV